MARKPRIEYDGAFYHIITRGNQGQKILKLPAASCRESSILKELLFILFARQPCSKLRGKRHHSLDAIARAVGKHEGVVLEELRSGTRVRTTVKAHKVFNFIARDEGYEV